MSVFYRIGYQYTFVLNSVDLRTLDVLVEFPLKFSDKPPMEKRVNNHYLSEYVDLYRLKGKLKMVVSPTAPFDHRLVKMTAFHKTIVTNVEDLSRSAFEKMLQSADLVTNLAQVSAIKFLSVTA
jgi:hypothetical protein